MFVPIRSHRPRKFSTRRPLPGLGLAVALGLLTAACSGERPELVLTEPDAATTAPAAADSGDTGTEAAPATEDETTTTTAPGLQETQCQTVYGPGPLQVSIEPLSAPVLLCARMGGFQTVEFTNNTQDEVQLLFPAAPVVVAPGSGHRTATVADLTGPGPFEIDSTPHPVTALWHVDPASNSMADERILLSGFGPVRIGMTASDIERALEATLLATDESACIQTAIEGDPYSPIFTMRSGSLTAIEVFSPNQATRSGIGVGSAENDVVAAYSENIVTEQTGDPNRKLLVFVPTDPEDQTYRLVFVVEGGVVTAIRNGLTQNVVPSGGC